MFFSENLVCFVFMFPPFSDLLFCPITDDDKITGTLNVYQNSVVLLNMNLYRILHLLSLNYK